MCRSAGAFCGAVAGILALAALAISGPAWALDKVTFGTNWQAEAEHGGFYQALADGTYKKYGLDVTIGRAARRSTTASCCGREDRLLHGRQPVASSTT